MSDSEMQGHGADGVEAAVETVAGARTAGEIVAGEEHKAPNYIAVWFGLFVLTVTEVGVAFVSHLPKHVIILLLVGMAIWKALLVALYYMHLRFEPTRLRLMALAPIPLAVIMVLAIMTEYL